MAKLTIQKELCKGCGICVATCPKKAIEFSGTSNRSSYEYVRVDEATCVMCGSCYKVCPDGVFVFSE